MSEELVMGVATVVPSPAVPISGAPQEKGKLAVSERGISFSSFEDCFRFAKCVIDSGLAPKGFQTPQAVAVAMQFGAELGLPPMAALQNVAVIQGRPTLWGDAVPGICQHLVEAYKDEQIGEVGQDSFGVRATVTRKGRAEPVSRTFTIEDAKRAGLWGKAGPWSQYPTRMLLMRARTFAYRDAFPDALRGLYTAEELQEQPVKNVTHSLDAFEKKEVA
jgi:hypothetical protein